MGTVDELVGINWCESAVSGVNQLSLETLSYSA